jgi:micrococcal nuclease
VLAAAALAGCGGGAPAAAPETVPVVEVVDGDTVRVRLDGRVQPVRVIGIDTPEPYREGDPEPCSREASEAMRELVEDRDVVLVADAEERDRYDRLLRYVEVDGRDAGEGLLRQGLARPLRVEPNTARAGRYEDVAERARNGQRGLWGGRCATRSG